MLALFCVLKWILIKLYIKTLDYHIFSFFLLFVSKNKHNIGVMTHRELHARVQLLKGRFADARDINLLQYSNVRKRFESLPRIKSQIAHQLGVPPNEITNARLKMWQLLHMFPLVKCAPNNQVFRYFDNAAFPGSFILAVLDWSKARNIEVEWLASSITRPGFLLDTFGLQKKFPRRWVMDEKNDGDVTNPVMIRRIRDTITVKFGLYTSDLGFNVNGDPGNQELLHARAFVGHCLLGLLILANGGNMVVKQYAITSELSQSIVQIMKDHFQKLAIVKPFFSKSGNDESYIVGIGFRGYTKATVQAMFRRMDAPRWDGTSRLCNLRPTILTYINTIRCQMLTDQISYLQDFTAGLQGTNVDRSIHRRDTQLKQWMIDYPLF